MLYQTMQVTDNGTITMYNSERNNESAHDMLAQADTVTIADNGNYSGQIGNKLFKLVFTEKFIVLAYHSIV